MKSADILGANFRGRNENVGVFPDDNLGSPFGIRNQSL